MLNMPTKEKKLAYGEKYNVFQTYPWLRYKIDPEAVKQKEIVTQRLLQQDVKQKFYNTIK